MNPAEIEPSTSPGFARGGLTLGSAGRLTLLLLAIGVVGALAVASGHRLARAALADLGPTDGDLPREFRDIEPDGEIYFRWTSVPSSSVVLPVRFCGPGSIRLRVRRHFLDPAILSVSVAGTVVGQASVRAREDHPYEVLEFPISKVSCGSNTDVLLEASVTNSRPLGVAVDWVEIQAPHGFFAPLVTMIRGSALLVAAVLALLLAGARSRILVPSAALLAVGLGFMFSFDPVAGERILHAGLAAVLLGLLGATLLVRFGGLLGVSPPCRTPLVALSLLVVLTRCIFLHPRLFYPDYRVHALVLQTLQSSGLPAFLSNIFEIQYARSLGLQQIDGRWYPFPYPPGFYVLAEGVAWLFSLNPLDSSLTTAIAAASVIPVLTASIGVSIGLGEGLSLLGALFVAFQPLLVRRVALGYFPGVVGQLADAVSLLLLIRLLKAERLFVRRGLWLVAAMLFAFLVYTQSIANFGLLVAGLLGIEMVTRRPGGLKPPLRVGGVATVALIVASGIFYYRYLPVLDSIANHQPLPESRVLDRLNALRESNPALAGAVNEDPSDDPFVGSGVDPARGLSRLGARLWRFNGPYAIAVAIGLGLIWRRSEGPWRSLVIAWGGVCVMIDLLAAGLPSPNGFQHLKDLEFVAPLLGLALGAVAKSLWDLRRWAAIAFAAGWIAIAASAFEAEIVDRVLALHGR